MSTVVIIGGGISGLAAAEAIERRSREAGQPAKAIVLEAEPTPGGKIGTLHQDGHVIEIGPHGFLDKEPKAMALIERLGLSTSMIAAREAAEKRYIVRAGKLRKLPGSPPAFVTSDVLPLFGRLRVMAEPLVRRRSDEAEETVWAFAARRIGRQAADVLVDAMVTGIYGGDPKRLSVRAAFPLLAEVERRHGSLIKGQLAQAKERRKLGDGGGSMGGPRGRLHSFRKGLGELIDALAARCEVRTGARAARVEVQGGLHVVTESGDHVFGDALVITAPAFEMARLLRPTHEAEAASLDEIRYAPVAVVVQSFAAEAFAGAPDGFGFLVPYGEGREILGSIWASSVFDGHAPTGRVMLRTLVGGARRPELVEGPEAAIGARARREALRLLGVREDATVHLERVLRWPKGIPQYELGHASKVAAADRLEAKVPGLFLGGNALRGVAMIQCVADADRVAERVVAWLGRR